MIKPFYSNSWAFIISTCLAAALAGLCFYPGLHGDFLFDDGENIINNASLHLHSLQLDNVLYAAYSFQPGHGSRALSMLSFALDYWRAGGLDPSAYKTTNILIHAITTVALAFFFRELLRCIGWHTPRASNVALFMAMLWAMHPLNVSTVLYIVQRMQALVTLFILLALSAYMKMRQAQIAGNNSKRHGLLTLLYWALGFAGKEDAALLPAYTLILELTIFRFDASNSMLAIWLKRIYAVLVLGGLLAYFLLLLPRYWSWSDYVGRDFNSYERVMTQGRILLMYLGQCLFPLPSTMHFYYDDLVISRSFLQPPTTALSWLAITILLTCAWRLRLKRPLFSLGLFLFFSGHAMTSNIINLEMAFEHRNHFPLVGIVICVTDIAMAILNRLKAAPRIGFTAACLALILLMAGTSFRSYEWANTLRMATAITQYAPKSERAWVMKSGYYVDKSRFAPGPDLDQAITITQLGIRLVEDPTMLLANLIIYKTARGDVQWSDWQLFLAHYSTAPFSAQNRRIVWTYVNNSTSKVVLNPVGVLKTIEIATKRSTYSTNEYLQLAAYIHNKSAEPDKAYVLLESAVQVAEPNDPDIPRLWSQLHDLGRDDWLERLKAVKLNQTH